MQIPESVCCDCILIKTFGYIIFLELDFFKYLKFNIFRYFFLF